MAIDNGHLLKNLALGFVQSDQSYYYAMDNPNLQTCTTCLWPFDSASAPDSAANESYLWLDSYRNCEEAGANQLVS